MHDPVPSVTFKQNEDGSSRRHTFSRKQTSPRVTSAQISKRASWRTKDSNSCASCTCLEGKEGRGRV